MNENEKMISQDTKNSEKSVSTKGNKGKRRFTVLDFALVVVLLLSVLGIGFRTVIADWIVRSAPKETISVSFKAEGITKDQLAQLKENDAFSVNGEAFGVLLSFSSQKSTKVIEQKDENGNVSFVTAEDQNALDVLGEVEVSGHYTDSGFVCQDDMNLYVGKILNIHASSYSITVIITEIPRK